MKKPKFVMSNELADKLSGIHWSQDRLKKLTLIKNVLESKATKEVHMSKCLYDEDWQMEEMTVEYYPSRKDWNKPVTLHFFPRDGQLERSRIELDIDENHTLDDIDDIARFLNDIRCEEWSNGIEIIEKDFKWE